MKIIKHLLTPAILALAVSTSFASPVLFGSHSGGKTIYTLYVTTPGNKEFNADELKIYGGTSVTNPCSDLAVKIDVHSNSQDGTITFVPGASLLSSGNISGLLGQGYTCMSVNVIANHKTYSIGNVQLVWDSKTKEYVGASPSSGSMNFNT